MKKIVVIIFVFISTFGFCQIEETQAYKDFESLSFQYLNQLEEDKTKEALNNALKAKEIATQNFKNHSYYSFTLNNIGYIYFRIKDYKSCLPYFLEVKEIKKNTLGTTHPEYAALVNQLGLTYVKLHEYKEAVVYSLEYSNYLKNNLGENHLDYGKSLEHLGYVFRKVGDFKKALPSYMQSSAILKENLGDDHPDYASSLNFIGIVQSRLGNHLDALENYKNAKLIWESSLGENHINIATALNNIATVYSDLGDFENAKISIIKAKEIQKKGLGEQHPNYATSLHNLATVYSNLGDYDNAIKYGSEAKIIREFNFGKNHPDYALTVSNLGYNYSVLGNHELALNYYFEAKHIWKTIFGKQHPDYAMSLNNIGTIYIDLGDFNKAIQFLKEAKELRKQIYGENHPVYGHSVNNLGGVYHKKREYKNAILYYEEAKQIFKSKLGEQHPDYAQLLNNLGLVYSESGSYSKGVKNLLEAKNIQASVLGTNHPRYALTLNNLGLAYINEGNTVLCEQNLIEAKDIRYTNFGELHIDYLSSINNLGDFYFENDEFSKSIRLKLKANSIFINQIENIFKFRSEKEKKSFLESNMFLYSDMIQSIAYHTDYKDEQLLNTVVNNSLIHKGLLLNASKDMLPKLESLSIPEISNKISSYKKKSSFVTNQLQISISNRVKGFEKHIDSLNNLEVELTKLYSKHFEEKLSLTKSWKEVILKENDIAIEFSHFGYNNGKWTDSTMYVAYLYKKDWKLPKAIPLFEEKQLMEYLKSANSPNKLYASRGSKAKATKTNLDSEDLYNLIWKPIELHLENIETIYFSPDGLLHKIPFAALGRKDEPLLCETYNLVQLSTTANISAKNQDLNFKNTLFIGGIDYEYTPEIKKQNDTSVAFEGLKSLKFSKGTRSMGTTWNYLPGTLDEVNAIGGLLEQKDISSRLLSNKAATEFAFKNFKGQSPSILHIATHGFFFENLTKKNPDEIKSQQNSTYVLSQDPLLRSGLILAGANYAWKHGNNPYEDDDGILTALEISNLDLSNTDMVILSACETGLGDIDGSEGVYGLQRAFKMAGVDLIMMSLWEVPDEETSEFMTIFYTNWLNGQQVRTAFRNTQLEMSTKYKDTPEKWAAFVLFE